MKKLNNSCIKASDMVPEVYVGPISQTYSSQFFFLILEWISDISVYKSNENMKNLNSSRVKASDMVPEVYVGSISQNCYWQFFFLILE